MTFSRPRIYADFNSLTESPRDPSKSMVSLHGWGSLQALSNAGIRLNVGIRLLIYDASDETEDLEAEATAYYDAEAAPDLAIMVEGKRPRTKGSLPG